MSFGVVAPDASAANDDITGHWAEKSLRYLNDEGIMNGYGNGIFKPNSKVTRAEFAAFVTRALDLPEDPNFEAFKDVELEKWYFGPIHKSAAVKIINGYPDGTFKPNNNISREHMAAVINQALKTKAIESTEGNVTFSDKADIHPDLLDDIGRVVSLKIVNGNPNGTYLPKNFTTRAEAAVVIHRLLTVMTPPKNYEYSTAKVNSSGEVVEVDKFETLTDAKNAISSNNQFIMKGKKIVWVKDGYLHTNQLTVVYTSTSLKGDSVTYVNSGAELELLEVGDGWVKVTSAESVGYVDINKVTLVPSELLKGRSYYKASSGELYHYIYVPQLNKYDKLAVGPAPSFLQEGKTYYSWDGNDFYTSSGSKVGQAYQYFQYLPLYSKTTYSAADLEKFIEKGFTARNGFTTSPLKGLGDDFKKAEQKYGVNALYFLAHAIHESNWGTSQIAQSKYNLFGWRATDTNPSENATTFASFEDGIDRAANEFIKQQYFNLDNWKYNGAFVGNKSKGMNVRYASDPYWGEKIAGLMHRADKILGGKDLHKYQLGVTLNKSTINVRNKATTVGSSVIYKYPFDGITFIINNEVNSSDGQWFNIMPIDSKYSAASIYHDGKYSNLTTELKVAK
ncbi:S-layer homology domain-containing protein [Pseudalkalibacillus berkeleyi]|uniref:S-layer homology domain-containing protein n=1 Tax=Pseudalkalibacillus berkeleyi TaxID=1069813 RepID=A0ABS9H4Q4_9BACL|nr:S-layer homology domain-containing protein [Pseudalkalibacillus berkeleyi]MCF6138773.1 S-layer homology domain-containing protein [Pseudalkalibacillus berkeleyi]